MREASPKLVFLLFSLFFSISLQSTLFSAPGEEVFYSGTFDPPTTAHLAIVEQCLSDLDFDKITIFVNEESPKSFHASVNERKRMLDLATEKWGDRVVILSGNALEKNRLPAEIQKTTNKPIFNVIGADSFFALPSVILKDANRKWIVLNRNGYGTIQTGKNGNVEYLKDPVEITISSTKVRQDLKNLKLDKSISDLPAEVADFILKKNLYFGIGDELNHVQKSFFSNAFERFLVDLQKRFYITIPKDITPPVFNANASFEAWNDSFMQAVNSTFKIPLVESRKLLEGKDSNGNSYPKYPYLMKTSLKSDKKVQVNSEIKLDSGTTTPFEQYPFDIQQYVEDRYPKPIQDIVKSEKMQSFFHLGTTEEALTYHAKEGYEKVVQINTFRGYPHRSFYILTSNAGTKRLVLADIRPGDSAHHVMQWMNSTGNSGTSTLVDHGNFKPLYELTDYGKSLVFSNQDELIFGFKNALWRRLENNMEWKRTNITLKGVEMSLLENSKTHNRIISVKSVYGDDLLPILEEFNARGIRKITYFGTAGGVNENLNVGDTLVPSTFSFKGEKHDFQNHATSIMEEKSKINPSIKVRTRQGHVRSIIEETTAFFETQNEAGVDAIDVESVYLANFLKNHPAVKGSIYLFVSDTPTKGVSLSEHVAYGHLVDQSFESIASDLFPIPTLKCKALNQIGLLQ